MKPGVIAVLFSLFTNCALAQFYQPDDIVDLKTGDKIAFGDFVTTLSKKEAIVLGESHGVEPHQRRAAFLIAALSEAGLTPALVLEMLYDTQTSKVDAHRQFHPENPDSLGAYLNWSESGWPDWNYYQSIFEVSYFAKLAVFGGDKEIDPATMPNTDSTETDQTFAAYFEDMDTAHCGLNSKQRNNQLAWTQMARDKSMASIGTRIIDEGYPALFLVGAAHARNQTGIPSLLAAETVSIRLFNYGKGEIDFSELDYDFAWLVPSSAPEGFCETLKSK